MLRLHKYARRLRRDLITGKVESSVRLVYDFCFRIIHDGPGSKTIFNGFFPFVDMLYTTHNNYIACT